VDPQRLHEEGFLALIEDSSDVLILVDGEGGTTYVGPSVKRVFGYDPEELVGTGFRIDLIHPDDREQAARALGEVVAHPRRTVRASYRVRRRDGSWCWIEATVTNLLDNPAVGSMVCHVRDVTERVELEVREREAEDRYWQLFDANPLPMWVYDLETLEFLAVNGAAIQQYGFTREEFLSMTLDRVRPESEIPRLHEWRDSLLSLDAADRFGSAGVWTQCRKDGSLIEVEPRWTKVEFRGRPSLLVTLTDVSAKRRAEEAEHEAKALSDALRDTAAALNSTLDYDEVLNRILESVGRVVEYDTVDIMLLESAVARIVRTFGFERFGIRSGDAQRMEFPLGQFENLRQIAESGQGRAVSDTTAFSPWVPIRGYEWVRSYVGAPIRVDDQVIGFLNLSSSRPGFYGEVHAHKLQAFADQAAVALKNSQLHREVRHSRERLESLSHQLLEVQEAERRSIARELHDEIGQVLTGLKLTLEMASTDRGEDGQGGLEDAVAGVNDLMDRVHGLILDLRPSMLDDLGLVPALLAHFERYTSQTGVQVRFEHRGLDRRFPSQVETAVYRIVQEALTNVARHAGVREVRVLTWSDGETVGVQAEDSGNGFDQAQALAEPSRSGLAGMRERAVLLGGRVDFDTAPGAGTRVAALIPLTAPLERRERPRQP
jgi:PAS domain S-box-containing protein